MKNQYIDYCEKVELSPLRAVEFIQYDDEFSEDDAIHAIQHFKKLAEEQKAKTFFLYDFEKEEIFEMNGSEICETYELPNLDKLEWLEGENLCVFETYEEALAEYAMATDE